MAANGGRLRLLHLSHPPVKLEPYQIPEFFRMCWTGKKLRLPHAGISIARTNTTEALHKEATVNTDTLQTNRTTRRRSILQVTVLVATLFSISTCALAVPQDYPPPDYSAPPPSLSPAQLDQLVARIALYPDPLLAQLLAAATYPDQIPDAAAWADDHHYLQGQDLANAISEDQLPWDPSVQALLPFPSVLEMMASDMTWTTQLGDAFLAQQADVENAIQRQRQLAYQYGYLRSNPEITVGYGPYITIASVNAAYIVVPAYDPGIVYFPPRPGFLVGGAIHFGFGITIGGFFRPWGWGTDRFDWSHHEVFINNSPWRRDWSNRADYQHPYPSAVRRYTPPAREEFRGRAEVERGNMPQARRPEARPAPAPPEAGRPAPVRPVQPPPAAERPQPERGPAVRPEAARPAQPYVRPMPGREQHQTIPRSPEEHGAAQGGNRPPAEQHTGGNSNPGGGNRGGRGNNHR